MNEWMKATLVLGAALIAGVSFLSGFVLAMILSAIADEAKKEESDE